VPLRSTAIYAGEDPGTHQIRNSIGIHITSHHAEPLSRPEWLREHIRYVPIHLRQYRDLNFDLVRHWDFTPSDFSSETSAIAASLGSCVVGHPQLQGKLNVLLKVQDKQHRSQALDEPGAIVLEALLALSRQERENVYALRDRKRGESSSRNSW
jgi:hypothetical protein